MDEIPEGQLVAYSGSRFDERILAQHMERNDVPVPCSLRTALDLHVAFQRAVAVPTTSRLKDVLKAFGVVHRVPDLDGFEAACIAMDSLRRGKPIPKRALAYNREDVRCLRELVVKVSGLAGITSPPAWRKRPSGGALRRAAEDKQVAKLLRERGTSIEELAPHSLILRERIRRNMRITLWAVEDAFGEFTKAHGQSPSPGA